MVKSKPNFDNFLQYFFLCSCPVFGSSLGPGPKPKLVPVLGPSSVIYNLGLGPGPSPGQHFWSRHTVEASQDVY